MNKAPAPGGELRNNLGSPSSGALMGQEALALVLACTAFAGISWIAWRVVDEYVIPPEVPDHWPGSELAVGVDLKGESADPSKLVTAHHELWQQGESIQLTFTVPVGTELSLSQVAGDPRHPWQCSETSSAEESTAAHWAVDAGHSIDLIVGEQTHGPTVYHTGTPGFVAERVELLCERKGGVFYNVTQSVVMLRPSAIRFLDTNEATLFLPRTTLDVITRSTWEVLWAAKYQRFVWDSGQVSVSDDDYFTDGVWASSGETPASPFRSDGIAYYRDSERARETETAAWATAIGWTTFSAPLLASIWLRSRRLVSLGGLTLRRRWLSGRDDDAVQSRVRHPRLRRAARNPSPRRQRRR